MKRPGVLACLILAACSEAPVSPGPGDGQLPPSDPSPIAGPDRIVVVNTLSETLSSLDLESGALTVQAALVGTWANRVTLRPGGDEYVVTASGDNEIEILSAHTFEARGVVDVGPGSNPWITVPLTRGEAIVTDFLSGDVRRIDLESGSVGPALRVTTGPEGVAVADGRAWVACTNYRSDGSFEEGRVDVVDLSRWSVIRSIPVGRNPQDLLVTGDASVHVLCTGTYGTGEDPAEGSVHVVDSVTYETRTVLPLGGSPGRLALDARGTIWVVGSAGGLRRYDTTSLELLADPSDPALAGPGFSAVDVDPVTGLVYVTHFDADLLVALEPDAGTITETWLVGDGPVDVMVTRHPSALGRQPR